jgi:multidrug efflux pump
VVWGLSFSTVLTLAITPVLLAAPKVMSHRFGWLWAKIFGSPKPRALKPYDIPRAAE